MSIPLFYAEPDPDRWLPFDRLPRRLIRRLVRGPRNPGGQERVFLNLKAGLDRLGITYRENDYRWALRNPSAPVGIVGKPFVLGLQEWRNPILFGASIMSHPDEDPDLPRRHPVKRILAPGEWMRRMCAERWGDLVRAWPVGIDTVAWSPTRGARTLDVLLYDKVRWDHARHETVLHAPIREHLGRRGLSFAELRYGSYREPDFHRLVHQARAMIFLCEHETQGIAYQQALACGVPILAWDRGGCWQDPQYYPHRVRFGPVSSVPYWDARCGEKFATPGEFAERFDRLWEGVLAGTYAPRDYILENLTLERCARGYLDHWEQTFGERVPGRR